MLVIDRWQECGSDALLDPFIHCQAYVERVVAGRTYQQPLGYTVFFLEHGMKTISVSAGGAGSELFLHFDCDDLAWHSCISTG